MHHSNSGKFTTLESAVEISESTKKYDLPPSIMMAVQIILLFQSEFKEQRDNEPFEDWSEEKIVSFVYGSRN